MKKHIKCLVLDDEPWAINLLKSYIVQVPMLDLVYTSSKPTDVLHYLSQHEADLIFLDIQMPDIDGIQIMKLINNKIKVIITSAYSEYALAGFEHNVLDYLLKPIGFDRFYQAVLKAVDWFELMSGQVLQKEEFIFIKSDSKFLKIKIDDILFLEGARDYVFIQTTTEKIITLDSLRNLFDALPPNRFERIHKSYIIALDKIDAVEKNAVQIKTFRLPIGDSYKTGLYKRLNL